LSEGAPSADEDLEDAKDFMTLYMLKKRSQPDPYLDNYYTDGMNGIKSKENFRNGNLKDLI
jgi:hypothetical protein